MDTTPIYQRYSGKAISDKLSVYKNGENYVFIYQKFKRTNPSQSERMRGFSQLKSVDFKLYPFEHLLENFYTQENLPQRSC